MDDISTKETISTVRAYIVRATRSATEEEHYGHYEIREMLVGNVYDANDVPILDGLGEWRRLVDDELGRLPQTDIKTRKKEIVNAKDDIDSEMDDPTPKWAPRHHMRDGARSIAYDSTTRRPATMRGGVKRDDPLGNEPKRIRRETSATTFPSVEGRLHQMKCATPRKTNTTQAYRRKRTQGGGPKKMDENENGNANATRQRL